MREVNKQLKFSLSKPALFLLSLLITGVLAGQQECSFVQEEHSFVIEGTAPGLPDGLVYLHYNETSGDGNDIRRIDSALSAGGRFVLTGRIAEPALAYLRFQKKIFPLFTELIIQPGAKIVVKADSSLKRFWRIAGTEYNEQWQQCLAEISRLEKERTQGRRKKREEGDSPEIKAELARIEAAMPEVWKAFAREEPGKITSVFALQKLRYTTGYDELQELFSSLREDVRNTAAGHKLQKELDVMGRVAMGRPFVHFRQKNEKGELFDTESLKGKYFLLDFWASWCGPCRVENKFVQKAYRQYKEQGLEVLAVSLDSDAEKWKSAIQEDGLNWLHISSLTGSSNPVARLYGVSSIPANFLVNEKGIIIARNLRGEKLLKKLSELFPE